MIRAMGLGGERSDFWQLPIGDRQHPSMRLVTDDGVTGLAMRFTSDPSRRGIVYCMANAGDRHLMVRVPVDGDQVIDLGGLPTPTTIN